MTLKDFFLFFVLHVFLTISSFSQDWDSIGSIKKYQTTALTTNGNKLYAGMDNLSQPGTCKIKVWDGSIWDSLCCSTPAKIIFHNNELFGCGGSSIGVAKYDGLSWQTIGQINSLDAVFDIHFYNNELYAAGGFDSIGGIKASCIARWDGSIWHEIDSTDFGSGIIYSAIHYNGELFIAGVFQNWNASLGLVCKWNGNAWEIPGGDINNIPLGSTIENMEVYNNELYLGGYIYPNGNNLHDLGIVRWDGVNWKDVGGGINGNGSPRVNRMMSYDNKLFVAGYFDTAGTIPASAIAIWDGTKWCGLGTEIDNQIFDFAFYDSSLVIAGNFLTVNSDSINYIAQWIGSDYEDTCSMFNAINENFNSLEFYCYPNPATSSISLHLPINSSTCLLSMMNLYGEKVEVHPVFNLSDIQFDISTLPPGMYIINLDFLNSSSRIKFIKI